MLMHQHTMDESTARGHTALHMQCLAVLILKRTCSPHATCDMHLLQRTHRSCGLGAGGWVFLVKNRGRFGTPYTRLAAASCGLTHTVAHMTRLHVSVRRMHLVECQCVQAYMSQETPMPYTRQPTLPCHNTSSTRTLTVFYDGCTIEILRLLF